MEGKVVDSGKIKPRKIKLKKQKKVKSMENTEQVSSPPPEETPPTKKLKRKEKHRQMSKEDLDSNPSDKRGKIRCESRLDKQKERALKREEAIAYLRLWANNRSEWRFQKSCQVRLIEKCLSRFTVPSEDFKTFRSYCKALKGGARSWLLQICADKIAEYEKADAEKKEEELFKDEYKRAVKITKSLNKGSS